MASHKLDIEPGQPRRLTCLVVHDGIQECHDRLACTVETNSHAKRLRVIKELLDGVRPRKDGEVMIQPAGRWGLVCCFTIPVDTHVGPNFAVSWLFLLDGHPIPAEIAETLYPRVLKGRHRLAQQGHHGVRQVDKGHHIFLGRRQTSSQQLQEGMNTMSPHPGGHRVLGRESLKGRAGAGMLGSQKKVMMLVEESAVQGDKRLPLFFIQFAAGRGFSLGRVDFDAFALDHDEAGINALDLSHQLLLRNGSGFGLLDHDGGCVLSWKAI